MKNLDFNLVCNVCGGTRKSINTCENGHFISVNDWITKEEFDKKIKSRYRELTIELSGDITKYNNNIIFIGGRNLNLVIDKYTDIGIPVEIKIKPLYYKEDKDE